METILITNFLDIVSYCKSAFAFQSVREHVLRSKINFLVTLKQCQNSLCSCLSTNRVASDAVIDTHTAQCVSATLKLIAFLGVSFWPLRPMLISNHKYFFYILLSFHCRHCWSGEEV